MATYKSFEDLPVWQSARELAVMVYRATAKGKLKEDYGLKSPKFKGQKYKTT